MTTVAVRYHDISVGHRVHNHESKCRHLHGHNYRIHFEVAAAKLDDIGRVMDFSVIKEKLCMWLEDNWDHKFLAWEHDSLMGKLAVAFSGNDEEDIADGEMFSQSIVWVPFNPTAENMAEYLVKIIGPLQLAGSGCRLVRVIIEETRKCSCSYTVPPEEYYA